MMIGDELGMKWCSIRHIIVTNSYISWPTKSSTSPSMKSHHKYDMKRHNSVNCPNKYGTQQWAVDIQLASSYWRVDDNVLVWIVLYGIFSPVHRIGQEMMGWGRIEQWIVRWVTWVIFQGRLYSYCHQMMSQYSIQ